MPVTLRSRIRTGYDGMLFLWVPSTGEKKASFNAHSKWITAIAWQPLHV